MDGLQKLSLALLPCFFAMLFYAFREDQLANQSMDQISLKLEESATAIAGLEREFASQAILNEIVDRVLQRNKTFKEVNIRMQHSITEADLHSWRYKIGQGLAQLKMDQGSLQQFDAETYPHLHKLATSLTNVLAQEGATWISLQQYLEKEADNSATPTEREQFLQHYLTELLEEGRVFSAHLGTLKASTAQSETLKGEGSLKSKQIKAGLNGYKRSIRINLILFTVSWVGIVMACFGVLGLRIRKKEPSRVVLP
jgi:hypothetical protein